MLSGIVINLNSRNKTDQWQYFTKRFIRIYPIYLSVLLICFLSDYLVMGHPIDPRVFTGNLFLSATLQGYLVSTMPLDPAVWSITCEVFFYIIFGLIYTSKRLNSIWIWFAVCCLSIIYKLLTNDSTHSGIFNHFIFLLNKSFLWVLGYLVFEYRDKFRTSLPVALCGVLMIPLVTRLHQFPNDLQEAMYLLAGVYLLPLFIYLLRTDKIADKEKSYISYWHIVPVYIISIMMLWHYSNSLAMSKIIYSLLPLLSFTLYGKPVIVNIKRIYNRSTPFLAFVANISYPLYLLHMPVMYLVFYLIPDQKFAGVLLIIFLTVSMSYLFEIYLFKKPSRLINEYSFLRLGRSKQDQP